MFNKDIVRPNPNNKDKSYCTVSAWAKVFDSSFDKADLYLRRFGRSFGRGMKTVDIERALASVKRYKVVKGPYSRSNRVTLKQFVNNHPEGRFYVLVRGRALAIIDGVVYDHTEKPRRQVVFAVRVYSKENL